MSKTPSFAHFFSRALSGAKASDEDDKPKGRRAEGPVEDDPADEQNAKGKHADGDDDIDPESEDDSPDEGDGKDDPKGKAKGKAKGKRAEDDDDKVDAEENDDEAPKAVRADRKRCAAIIAYGLANGCAEQAGALAFDTNLNAAAALGVLKAGGSRAVAPAAALRDRMASLSIPQVGADATQSRPKGVSAVAAGIIAAGQ